MHSSAQCLHCEGRGKCPDCDGSGINRDLNTNEVKCAECSATERCNECDGSGKSSLAMPLYKGSLLTNGLIWAAIVLLVFCAFSFFSSSRFYTMAIALVWTIGWIAVLCANHRKHERRNS